MANLEQVREDIKAILKKEDYDDGSLGPVFVRLAWHASGTYDKKSGTGGSNGATMRYKPESSDDANAGLEHARAFLEPIKSKNPSISYADLWTLAGVVAVEAMGGPIVPWKAGRSDKPATVRVTEIPPNGRLPDAAKGADHIRDVFYRMGFNDREIVALSGAHSLGRCHTDRSGFEGPWTFSPTRFSNQYFTLLVNSPWTLKTLENGQVQYKNKSDKLMMLPTDIALIEDEKFKPIVVEYAENKDVFYKDFAAAFGKLLELGISRSKM